MDAQKRTEPSPLRRAGNGELGWFGLALALLEAWYTTCITCVGLAIAHEELYRLSDRRPMHRGQRRATLARDVTGFDVTYHADC